MAISLILGFHRVSITQLFFKLLKNGYASQFPTPIRITLCFYEAFTKSLESNLEQIESAFCPIKHIERVENVTSDHHKNFFERDEINKMRKQLTKDGTVSNRKMKY